MVVHDAVRQYARTPFSEEVWRHLSEGVRFVQGTFDDDNAFDTLPTTLGDLDRAQGYRRQPCVLPVDPARCVSGGAASSSSGPGCANRMATSGGGW